MIRRRLALGILFFVLLAATPGLSLKPNRDGHLGITREALGSITKVVNGQTVRFSERAILQTMQANKDTDAFNSLIQSERHFDNELFLEATTRLVNLKEGIVVHPAKTGQPTWV